MGNNGSREINVYLNNPSRKSYLSQNENARRRANIGIRLDHVVPLPKAVGCGRASVGGDEDLGAVASVGYGRQGVNRWAWADVKVRGGKFSRWTA